MNTRQEKILELLERNDRLSVNEIKNIFNVSEMTVRRDLNILEELGYVTRTYGGVTARPKLYFNNSFNEREKINVDKKKKIAQKAVELIEQDDNIILDTGTTTLYLARELVKKNIPVTVATTSLAVASELFNSQIDVLLFGGFLRRQIPDLIGPLTEKNLKTFHGDKLFMGCDGMIPEEGFYTSDLNISHLEEQMVKIAEKVILIADSTKFGKKSFVKFADTNQIQTIITDNSIQKEIASKLQNMGLEVIIAEVN